LVLVSLYARCQGVRVKMNALVFEGGKPPPHP
jgi:hypothetical protein